MRFFAALFALVLPLVSLSADRSEFYSQNVASLIDPAKLATLGKRGANPRVQKAVALLENARLDGCQVATVASNAVFFANYTNALLAQMTREALTRNHDIARKLGVLNPIRVADMKRGQSPTIKRGPYAKQELTVDHVVPVAVVPELDCVIANLELMPAKLNSAKGDKMGQRQRDLAKEFNAAGLLSDEQLRQVLRR